MVDAYGEFLESSYKTEVMRRIREGKRSILIDFAKLERFDPVFSEKLLENPEEELKRLDEALNLIKDSLIQDDTYKLKARIYNLPKTAHIKIRDIRADHLGKLIAIKGQIRKTSDVRPKVSYTVFACPVCSTKIPKPQTGTVLEQPFLCPSCGRKGKFKLESQELIDIQHIVVEEIPEELYGAEQPKRISTLLTEDLLDPEEEKKRYPGNNVILVGLVKEIPITGKGGEKTTKFEILLDVNSVEMLEEAFEEIKITKEDEKKIKELAQDPEIYKKLVDSFANSIYGYEEIKEAIILQLFGGLKKIRPDGTRDRGDVHVLLVGDPGAGKSQLLKVVQTIAPKARYVVGKSASGAGITAAVVRDELLQGWALEAGALVLANKGIALIDELDKMDPEDRSAMHEAMEQQSITISKANIQATLRAETSILGAANPKFGRFDPYSPVANQIDMPPTLINRFDLIFIVLDIPDIQKDEKMSAYILNLQKGQQEGKVKQLQIPQDFLKKYIAYAKQTCFPRLTSHAIEEIQNFYVSLRSAAASEEQGVRTVPISPRQLVSLVRLAEASARVRLSPQVLKQDAERAIYLLKACMQAVGTDPETGKFDIDRIASGISAKERNKLSIIQRIIIDLETKLGKTLPEDEIIRVAETEGMQRSEIEEILESLKRRGDIYEPRQGVIQRMT